MEDPFVLPKLYAPAFPLRRNREIIVPLRPARAYGGGFTYMHSSDATAGMYPALCT